jgi:ATP adenylyltransferase
MDHLWTPWRYAYITRSDPQARTGVAPELADWPAAEDKHCVFCNMIAATDYAVARGMPLEIAERASHILYRGQHCFLCLNAYPYATGHVLILPYLHIDSLAAAPTDAANEMIELAQRTERALRTTYRPDGINLGMNLGDAAGAGVAGHIHMHVLPRWIGDTNFMTVTAETRVLPEALDTTWKRLRDALKNSATPRPGNASHGTSSL